MSSNELNILKRYFESKSIHVSIYWIECCLEWFKEQNTTFTNDFMCSEVMGQWLESDLRDIEVTSLPCGITTRKKYVLHGNYAVQVMYVKDISRSSYSQLKTIRDMYKLTRSVTDEDTDATGIGKRVLNVHMTDGVQYINSFEYQPVSSLDINMAPGIKILLVGPLSIRNGEILLKENNVKILGGQVEDLLVKNAVENILARELNLPENPTPGQLQSNNENAFSNNQVNINNYNAAINENTNSINNVSTNSNSLVTSNNLRTLVNIDETNQKQNNSAIFNTDDEDEMLLLNMDHYDEDNINDDIMHNINIDDNNMYNTTCMTTTVPVNQNIAPPETSQYGELSQSDNMNVDIDVSKLEGMNEQQHKHDDNYDHICIDDELELMERIEEEMKLKNVDTICKSPILTNNVTVDNLEPFIYIRYLLDNRNTIIHKVFKVKARFHRVIEKLSVNKTKGWTMKFEIIDSSGTITVDFLSSVIEELMGLSPNEALAENRKVKNKINQSHEKLSVALKDCKEKIDCFEYLLHLQFKEYPYIPTIIRLERIQEHHLEKLKNRVENSQIKLL